MRKLGWVVGLVLVVGLLGAARCPAGGLPVTRVENTTAGGYMIWIQNTTTCAQTTFNIKLQVPVARLTAVAINGTGIASIAGSGQLWTVRLVGAGLRPGGFLVLSVTGANPVVEATCAKLVGWVLTTPPVCR